MSAIQKLWPDPPQPPRVRPLNRNEEPASMQRVWLAGGEVDAEGARTWRFSHWMWCGRQRYALLLCGEASCRELHVASAERIRVDA